LAQKVLLRSLSAALSKKTPPLKGGPMNPNSMEFIYRAMSAIASGKHNPETEKCLSVAIEEELLAMNASLVLASWRAKMAYTPEAEAHFA
jgi:hypothetical protein